MYSDTNFHNIAKVTNTRPYINGLIWDLGYTLDPFLGMLCYFFSFNVRIIIGVKYLPIFLWPFLINKEHYVNSKGFLTYSS